MILRLSSRPEIDPLAFRYLLANAGFPNESIKQDGVQPIWWLHVGETSCQQGWKLHVSSRCDQVSELLARILPLLQSWKAVFKIAGSFEVARRINSGEAGLSQIGKLVTVYPNNDKDAVNLGKALVEVLQDFPGPIIDNELRLDSQAPVYARYGSFRRTQRTKIGMYRTVVEDLDGNVVPDQRSIPMYRALGIPSPFLGATESSFESLLDDRFLVVGQLAETRHSKIFCGVDIDTAQTCVLKVVRYHTMIGPSGHDSAYWLKHEWSILKQLDHTGIVPRPIALIDSTDRVVLAMEYIQGKSLLNYVSNLAYASPCQETFFKIAFELVSLVDKVHNEGLILNDFNPSNVILESAESLKLIDLERVNREGCLWSFAFTNGFVSPTLIEGMPLSKSHDLYSLAATIYYLVTGTNLATMPQYDVLIRHGEMLVEPWSQIIKNLISATPLTASSVLSSTKKQLHALAKMTENTADTCCIIPRLGNISEDGKFCNENGSESKIFIANLGKSIASLADWDSTGPGIWISRHPSIQGKSFRDFYMGDAGIALGLLRIGLGTENLQLVQLVIDVAERLWVTQSNEVWEYSGLFIGEAGVGLLYLTLSEILGDSLWLERAVRVSRRLSQIPYSSPDITHGAAGRGLYHLWVYDYTEDHQEWEAGMAAFQYLEQCVENTANGPFWLIPSDYEGLSQEKYYGVAHGSAGIGYFLAEIILRKNVEKVAILLNSIGCALQAARSSFSESDLCDWPATPEGPFLGGVWCHGSTGIALSFLKMYQAVGNAEYLIQSIDAAENAFKLSHLMGPTQCHGLSGLIEVFLNLLNETDTARYLMISQQLGQRLQKIFLVNSPFGPMICSEEPNVVTADFMIGSSGAAAALARLQQPNRFGHFMESPKNAFHTISGL